MMSKTNMITKSALFATALLSTALSSASPLQRQASDDAAVRTLVKASLSATSKIEQDAALMLVNRYKDKEIAALLINEGSNSQGRRQDIFLAASRVNPFSRELAIRYLDSRKVKIVKYSVEVLASSGAIVPLPALTKILKNPNPALRARGYACALSLSPKESFDLIKHGLSDGSALVRCAAINTLPRQFNSLLVEKNLFESNSSVLFCALNYFSQIDPHRISSRIKARIRELASSNSATVRASALVALYWTEDADTKQIASRLISDKDEKVRLKAANILELLRRSS